jgi:tRNA pseudouridine55 synthase
MSRRRAQPDGVDGLIVVDKPAGLTSHDVVGRIRRVARTRRVGHAGTLDPMATGVLVIGVNKATRLLHHLVLADKSYRATIRLGQATTTDDAEGEVIAGSSARALAQAEVLQAIAALRGHILQVPSSVSAIKIDGERAYARVRAGEAVELAARPVTVSGFEVASFGVADDLLDIDVRVDCSSGTYVRALARDLGAALGVGGHLTALRRTRVGPFTVERALTLDELAALAADHGDPVTLSLAAAVRLVMPTRDITDEEATTLSFGRTLEPAGIQGTHAALDPAGVVIALLVEETGRARPILVFNAAG